MKKLLILPFILLALACQAQSDSDRRTLSTNGYGEVNVTPDEAVIHFTARATHRTGKTAKENVDGKVNRLLASLEKLSITKDDVVASQLRINPRYEYRNNSGNQFVGYEASRTVQITITDLTALTDVMDAGLTAGIHNIDALNYQSKQAKQHQLTAHQRAIENSIAKATALAEAYGAELGPILKIEYHNQNTLFSPKADVATLESVAFKSRASQAAVYLPDQITFSDRIQVVFDLIVND